jgi:hypothetical protein
LNLIWRVDRFGLDDGGFGSEFLVKFFCNLLSTNTKRSNMFTATFSAGGGKVVLGFADMTKSNEFAIQLFMIGNGDATFFTLRDETTVVADETGSVAFFIYDNSDFAVVSEIFCYRFIGQFGKVMIQLFGHIHEENIFMLVRMSEMFVIHWCLCSENLCFFK